MNMKYARTVAHEAYRYMAEGFSPSDAIDTAFSLVKPPKDIDLMDLPTMGEIATVRGLLGLRVI